MDIRELAVPDSYVLDLVPHGDSRGRFTEWYRADVLAKATGFRLPLAQANHSVSARGVLRGVHFALVPPGQAKYVYCPAGRVLDVVVDVRVGSPTFGRHVTTVLSAENWRQMFVPAGFAHGFATLEPNTEVLYKVTNYYSPGHERGIRWNDPKLGIDWGVSEDAAVLSERDRKHPMLAEMTDLF